MLHSSRLIAPFSWGTPYPQKRMLETPSVPCPKIAPGTSCSPYCARIVFEIRGPHAFTDVGIEPKSGIFPNVNAAPAEEKADSGGIWAGWFSDFNSRAH
jgi:hypothetical protein